MYQNRPTTSRTRLAILATLVAAGTLAAGLSLTTQASATEKPAPVGCGKTGCTTGFEVSNATDQTLTPTSARTQVQDPSRHDSWESPSGWGPGTPNRGDLLMPHKSQNWKLFYWLTTSNTGTVEYNLSGGGQIVLHVATDGFGSPSSDCQVKNTNKVTCVAEWDHITISPA
ncbi:hypothetical protein [Streptacidiphilus jiangxiensis]|uniref:Secreted protein n=1 Tax=Streptacidiphilus jiangxiensis TaxID=235985 RepID=A0A1H7XMY9_STRJI|nr:hypothetical protein [Streptacidiphilus jiangxiensis]SEM35045.1 hypothetical protein SAMN05414137_124120 [Streptacidiphilus jiangxiensis]